MIPLKIETLLDGRVVEHDRVEYNTGWNPNDIIHSICAFANDYDNTNGGYIVIGVKEEKSRAWYSLLPYLQRAQPTYGVFLPSSFVSFFLG